MATRNVSNWRETFVHASQYIRCRRKRTRLPNVSGSSCCCESRREACWQESRIILCLARLRIAETGLFEAGTQHHARPIELYPDVGRGQAQILTQFLRVAAEYLAQHEYLADALGQLVDATLHRGQEAFLLAQFGRIAHMARHLGVMTAIVKKIVEILFA